ncbi:hypothetical protein LTR05_002917 [Lithohypha guttulata]|uniref:Major facilitator superfamily (MFS) profile domain-containing protein n=1 Tax=Lithohypha guttulata TaxID=1690604 RepID=A0AAN7YIF8_9EURO|nr:hypothetical protein LTR05_002917 [Lithohypha guttulata]
MGQSHDTAKPVKQTTAGAEELPESREPTLHSQVTTPEVLFGHPVEPSTTTQSNPYGCRPKCFASTFSECLFVITTSFAIGQTAVLTGALMVSTARIQQGLNMNSSEVTWVVAGNSLTAGCTLLFFGKVADLFGRRSLLVYSMGLFTICMLITSFSQNAIMAEIFLALSGLTCASVVPPAIGKLGAIYEKPSRRKNRAFACFSAGNPIGFVAGAIIGGIATEVASWRTMFWTITVLYASLTMVAWFTTPQDSEQALGGLNKETLAQMDWLGALLAVAGIASFVAAFTQAPDASNGWGTPYVIAMLVVGVLLMASFLYWQSVFKHPLMPLRVWRDRNFSLLVASLCLMFYGFNSNFFWLALGWQRAYNNSSLEVAVKLLPAAIGGMVVNFGVALVQHKVSNKGLSIFAASCSIASCALLSATSKTISYWALSFAAQLFAVLGADIAFCVTNLYVMSSLPPAQQSVGGGIFQTVIRIASTIGLGVSTTVFAAAGGSTEVSVNVAWRPYQSAFWVGLVGAVIGFCLTPLLTIGRQGHRQEARSVANRDGGDRAVQTTEKKSTIV